MKKYSPPRMVLSPNGTIRPARGVYDRPFGPSRSSAAAHAFLVGLTCHTAISTQRLRCVTNVFPDGSWPLFLAGKALTTDVISWVGRKMIMQERAGEGRYKFGILFVGGIEHQRPDSAIASFSAALYAWLVDWNYNSGPPPDRPLS